MKAILMGQRSGPALLEVPEPRTEKGGALIAVEACGLCGTDLLKIFQKKRSAILGHEIVGRIAKIRGTNGKFKEGDRVVLGHHVPCGQCRFCREDNPAACPRFKATNIAPGGFSEIISVSALHMARAAFKVPENLDSLAACQTEPLACCLRNVRRLGLKSGDFAAVIGLGSIGFLIAQLLRGQGVRVLGLDLDRARLKIAARWASGFTDAAALKDEALSATSGRGLDAVIITAGPADLATQSLGWLRHGGTLNVFAEPKPSLSALDFSAIYHRELRILSSYSATPDDLSQALGLIASRKILLSPLKTASYALADFNRAVEDVRTRRVMKAFLIPSP